MKKQILTILAALAIGAGSLNAELTQDEIADFNGWARELGFHYVKTNKYEKFSILVFQNVEERSVAYVPDFVETVKEARFAFFTSGVMFDVLAEGGKKRREEAYKVGYDEGWAAAKQDQPQPEVRKALPVASVK
jgi:hypothetical protein